MAFWMRVGAVTLGAACFGAWAPPAAAEHYYFNKPGVTRDVYVADALECAELAGGVKSPNAARFVSVPSGPYSLYALPIASLFAGLAQGAQNRRIRHSVERTCMADKGYARMQVDKQVVRDIDRLKDEQHRLDRLFGLASSTSPIGKRMPE